MNECPFCGMHLNCNNNDFWICKKCNEVWIRIRALPLPKSEIERNILKILQS